MSEIVSLILLGALAFSAYVSVKYFRKAKTHKIEAETYKRQYYDAINPPPPPPRGEATRVSRESYDIIRVSILERDYYRCHECGYPEHLEVHHIKPKSEGGNNDPSNLITLCRKCHAKHHGHNIYTKKNKPSKKDKRKRKQARNQRKKLKRYLNNNRRELRTEPAFHAIMPDEHSEMIERRQWLYEKWENNELNQLPQKCEDK